VPATTPCTSPGGPADRIYDVFIHEWSQLVSVRDYGFDVPQATAAMNSYFGGSGLVRVPGPVDMPATPEGSRSSTLGSR